MKQIVLSVEGMTCSACSNGLEKYLNKQNGIMNASVNLVMANVLVTYDDKILTQEKIEKYIKQAGFTSLGIFKKLENKKINSIKKTEFVIFSILALFFMYITMGHMLNLPIIPFFDMTINTKNYLVTLLIMTMLFLIYGRDILKNGFKNLIHKIPNMDTLVLIGVISSLGYSIYGAFMVIKGNYQYLENLYFESSAIILYFIKLGRYIDSRSKEKTKDSIKKLVEITPNEAVIEINGVEKKVTLDEIKKGDILISKPGEKIAVDGIIVRGNTHLDESFITGESKPVEKGVNDNVIAGSINYDGFIKYKAEKIGKNSTISEIVRLVIEATNTKMPITKIVDKISGYFVPVIIVIAVFTFLVYLILEREFSESISTFVTILVVACPCSLGLATPLALVVSEGKCVSEGILVKNSEVLETLPKVNTIVFDKTGTLTYGKLRISDIFNYSELSDDNVLQIVGSLEKKSTHPIGKAFSLYMDENKIEDLKVIEFENIPGYGIVGKVENEEIVLGSKKILEKFNIENTYLIDEKELSKNGSSIVYVVKDKKIIALIGVNDVIRHEAKSVINKLKELEIKTIMLTGDNKEVAQRIGNELEIDKIIADVLPAEKFEIISNLKLDENKVIMCGDGINDSPALTKADVGISVKSGTDIAIDSSDVILINNDLESIIKLINISKNTIRNIRQNLFWAFFYNCLMIPIAAGLLKNIGITISPMFASIAMVLSSITVILNALRLK